MHRGKRTQSLCFGGFGADQNSYNWYALYRVVSPKNHRHSGSSTRRRRSSSRRLRRRRRSSSSRRLPRGRSSSGSTWGSKAGSGNHELVVISN